MFGKIARRYDLLNHLLSLNLDRGWRRRALRCLDLAPGDRFLDLCTGTGDLALLAARSVPGVWVAAADFALPMLEQARRKIRRRGLHRHCALLAADALRLPFSDGAFHAAAVAFGVRNWVDRAAGLAEMARVLRPGGRLVILEFSRPQGPLWGRLYRFYLRRVLPKVGDPVSGIPGPYLYLARSVEGFLEPEDLAGLIRDAGFAAVGWERLTGGVVTIHQAFRGPAPPATAGAAIFERAAGSRPGRKSPTAANRLHRR